MEPVLKGRGSEIRVEHYRSCLMHGLFTLQIFPCHVSQGEKRLRIMKQIEL